MISSFVSVHLPFFSKVTVYCQTLSSCLHRWVQWWLHLEHSTMPSFYQPHPQSWIKHQRKEVNAHCMKPHPNLRFWIKSGRKSHVVNQRTRSSWQKQLVKFYAHVDLAHSTSELLLQFLNFKSHLINLLLLYVMHTMFWVCYPKHVICWRKKRCPHHSINVSLENICYKIILPIEFQGKFAVIVHTRVQVRSNEM